MSKPLVVVDASGNLPDAADCELKAKGVRWCWIGHSDLGPMRAAAPSDLLTYKGRLEDAFTRHESIQHKVEHWLADAPQLTLLGDGYGAFLVALGAFYRRLPSVYIAPLGAQQSPYFPLIAALSDMTRLSAATPKDPRLALLKGPHLKGRLQKT